MPQIPQSPPVPRPSGAADTQLRLAASVVIAAIVIAGVYFARPILVPLALAILLAFALAPAVEFLRRIGAGHVLSVLLATLFAMAVIGAVVTFIGSQLAHLATELPHYQRNIGQKIHSLETTTVSNNVIGRTSSLLNDIGKQLASPAQNPHQPDLHATPREQERPIPVVVRQPAATPLQIIENVTRPLLDPLATAGIAVIFVVFILLQKEDLRDRFIWVAGTGDLQRAKVALDDGASRVSRYLLTQTAINTTFGSCVGAGLWFVGVPNPWLWGLVTAMLRFIPYVGVPLAAAAPVILSLAVDPGWSKVFWTAALYLVLEPITGQVVEPFLYGRTVGLSPVAIVVAATFWTWVWGPVGLLLSTPLTLCLAVLGRHVERLKFLDVLLGNRPPLAYEESFYLRILAGDPDDAAKLAETYLKQHSLCEYYDVALKALVFAQADCERGALDAERCADVKELIRGVIQNLSDRPDAADTSTTAENRVEAGPQTTGAQLTTEWLSRPVLCVAGRNALDEAAALMLMDLLEKHRIGARLISAVEASPANIEQLDTEGTRFICLSYLDAGSGTNAHYLMRRLRRRVPSAQVIAGFWGLAHDNSQFLDTVATTGCDVITTFGEALERILAAAGGFTATSLPAPPRGSAQKERLADAAA